jgi:hypothetical protein
MDRRLDAAFDGLRTELKSNNKWPGGLTGAAINTAWSLFLRGMLRDAAIGAIRAGLTAKQLL